MEQNVAIHHYTSPSVAGSGFGAKSRAPRRVRFSRPVEPSFKLNYDEGARFPAFVFQPRVSMPCFSAGKGAFKRRKGLSL